MTDEAIKILAHAFITSQLDYCNALYCGEGLLSRLQSVQNAAGRLVKGLGRRQHITPVLRHLHWLLVRQHAMSKLTTLVYEMHWPTCATSVTLHHLLECVLCAQLIPEHVYFTTHTMVMVFVALPLPVLVCGTVCRCCFKNRTFH